MFKHTTFLIEWRPTYKPHGSNANMKIHMWITIELLPLAYCLCIHHQHLQLSLWANQHMNKCPTIDKTLNCAFTIKISMAMQRFDHALIADETLLIGLPSPRRPCFFFRGIICLLVLYPSLSSVQKKGSVSRCSRCHVILQAGLHAETSWSTASSS